VQDVMLVLLLTLGAPIFEPAFDERVDPTTFDTVAIAPLDQALTFARDAGGRVLAVIAYTGGTVRGVTLDASDPITLVQDLGYDGVVAATRGRPTITMPAASLAMPVDLRDRHVAAATNFPEHAGDAGVKDGPFLFPKLVTPTGPRAPIPAGQGLLDYEVEIAWVPLAPIVAGAEAPGQMGLVLCNDVTDRETLLRVLDPWDVASGTGFTTGKSFPGFLPVGDLFVVPRDHRAFAKGLTLQLSVNGTLRQRSPATAMVWDVDEIVARTWAWKDRTWDHRGAQVGLLGAPDAIPARAMILSGTPHGTVFDGMRARHYAAGLGAWLLGGWREPVPKHVVEAYIADARRSGVYLQPGDTVDVKVDGLGVLRNVVAR
jgi:2-keto-4-pentenoate hydratase/2-oxohepta-3-ene-1,7-dioic acid hydratase in catechol pathway